MSGRIRSYMRLALCVVAVATAAWCFAAGCSGQSAPTGGTSTPVAVDIPSAFDQATFDNGKLQ